jgi:hypothetical protein
MRGVIVVAQPNFVGKLGRAVNVESLVKLFGEACDRGELDAKRIGDHRF